MLLVQVRKSKIELISFDAPEDSRLNILLIFVQNERRYLKYVLTNTQTRAKCVQLCSEQLSKTVLWK